MEIIRLNRSSASLLKRWRDARRDSVLILLMGPPPPMRFFPLFSLCNEFQPNIGAPQRIPDALLLCTFVYYIRRFHEHAHLPIRPPPNQSARVSIGRSVSNTAKLLGDQTRYRHSGLTIGAECRCPNFYYQSNLYKFG